MKTELSKEQAKKVFRNVAVYAVIILIVVLLRDMIPPGLNNVGLWLAGLIFLFVIIFVIFLGSLADTILYNRSNLPSTLVHLLAGLVLFFLVAR